MLSTLNRSLAAAVAALSLCAAPAWSQPATPAPLPPKDPPIGGGYQLPVRPASPCMDERDPGPVLDCGRHHPPPCCCAAYDAPLRCPERWRDLEDHPNRDPVPAPGH